MRRIASRVIALSMLMVCLGSGRTDTAPAIDAASSVTHTRGKRVVTLCTLMAKPGNAFTFVRPRAEFFTPDDVTPEDVTVSVTYVGFDAFPGAQAAFEYAVQIWRANIDSPVTLAIRAEFAALGPGVLGSAGAESDGTDTAGAIPTTFYGDGLADRLAGADTDPGYDIVGSFSNTADWYFGTDGVVPGGKYDFVSVVLHELGHGLGFSGYAYVFDPGGGPVGGIGAGGIPGVFDLFTVDDSGDLLLGMPNDSAELAVPLLSAYNAGNPLGPGAYWGGPAGKAANGGVAPRLYTPSTWSDGSSYSHLDEDAFPEGNANSLMTFQLAAAEAIHDPGPITVGMFDDMGWGGRTELVMNGDFSGGMTNWIPFASVTDENGDTTTDLNYIQHSIVSGMLEYYRVGPTPPDTSTSAVVLQNTGVPFGAGEQILATFSVGNSDSVRRRISVLIHDQNFTDLSVCTFWIPPFAPVLTYKMLTHTTAAWTGASISFYAATAGSTGGGYLLDDVSMVAAPTAVAAETRCLDPWFPLATPDADSAELLGNASFDTGMLSPWQTFGTLTHQIAGNVFEFTRDSSMGAAGVILQPTGTAAPTDSIVTASFDLGNSSNVRKRVTVLLHDLDFSDLTACTFWLAPMQPLSRYLMRSYVAEGWGNATLSVYAATVGTEQWTRFDNASMKITPATQTLGTECGEPGGAIVAGRAPDFIGEGDAASAAASVTGATSTTSTKSTASTLGKVAGPTSILSTAPAVAAPAPATSSGTASSTGTTSGTVLGGTLTLLIEPTDDVVAIQVSEDGITWTTVMYVVSPDDWAEIELDLSQLLGKIYVRVRGTGLFSTDFDQ